MFIIKQCTTNPTYIELFVYFSSLSKAFLMPLMAPSSPSFASSTSSFALPIPFSTSPSTSISLSPVSLPITSFADPDSCSSFASNFSSDIKSLLDIHIWGR
uniref:Uncharacterized protein n=1 Tax=Streptococcus suis TaxID=1307 RepID=Q84BI9_STRSU|nr:hypothetical protein [Streptococcus suis]